MNFCYVHRYGDWHIAEPLNEKEALCGEVPQLEDWNSRMKFRDYDPQLIADDRPVCAMCLLLLSAAAELSR